MPASTTRTSSGTPSDEIDKALDSKKWVDAYHLDPKGGEAVFEHLKNAVKDLSKLAGDPKSQIPPATLQGIVDNLVDAAALLAQTAVDDAIAAGAPATRS